MHRHTHLNSHGKKNMTDRRAIAQNTPGIQDWTIFENSSHSVQGNLKKKLVNNLHIYILIYIYIYTCNIYMHT